jgi:hypothetical protein
MYETKAGLLILQHRKLVVVVRGGHYIYIYIMIMANCYMVNGDSFRHGGVSQDTDTKKKRQIQSGPPLLLTTEPHLPPPACQVRPPWLIPACTPRLLLRAASSCWRCV